MPELVDFNFESKLRDSLLETDCYTELRHSAAKLDINLADESASVREVVGSQSNNDQTKVSSS